MAIDFDERAVERWRCAVFDCAIVPSPFGNLNGYVRLPRPLRPLAPRDFMDWPRTAAPHGGVTYGVDENGWVGFDTVHAWDIWPRRTLKRFAPEDNLKRTGGSEIDGYGPEEPDDGDVYLDYDPCSVAREHYADRGRHWSLVELVDEVEWFAIRLLDPYVWFRMGLATAGRRVADRATR